MQVHVRGGSILPLQQPAMSIEATVATPFSLLVALDDAGQALGSLFVDDGGQLQVGLNALNVAFSAAQAT